MSSYEQNEFVRDILLHEHAVAVDLYTHEDKLNWEKLNHLLYISAALAMTIAFFLNQSNSLDEIVGFKKQNILAIIETLGLIVSAGFFIAVHFGIEYMQIRKFAVIEIEERLVELGGSFVVKPKKKVKAHRVSPTTMVLRGVPMVIALLWATLLGFNLFRLF